MTLKLPDSVLDLFDVPALAHVATVMSDGTPQVTPVWIDYDGEYLMFTSVKGRAKDRNLRARPDIAMSIVDPADPLRYLWVRGRVVEVTEEGADDHIDKMSLKYMGEEKYQLGRPGQVRVLYKIAPERFGGARLG